jgi:hypothetical protein
MNEYGKRLIELSLKLKSKKCREDLLFYAETMVRAQEALKKDYELESAIRRQYGLSPDGYNTNSPAQSGAAAQI